MAAFILDASGIVKRYLVETGSGWVQGSDRFGRWIIPTPLRLEIGRFSSRNVQPNSGFYPVGGIDGDG
jgi:hypothetical protein